MHDPLVLGLQAPVAAQAQCYVCGIPGAALLKHADPLARAIHGRIARPQGWPVRRHVIVCRIHH